MSDIIWRHLDGSVCDMPPEDPSRVNPLTTWLTGVEQTDCDHGCVVVREA